MPEPISAFAQSLAATPKIAALPAAQMRIVVAMRIAVLAWKKRQDPKPYLVKQLGDEIVARHFAHIIELMSDCWPEPMAVHRPCCQQTSYDEMLMLDLTTAAVQREPDHFHGLLGEMIGRSDRQKLHFAFTKFAGRFQR
ncbi:hypothetical protein [Sphingorhabdus sp. YGSMI21]|uniref:hypothetical protein n=1 Tax=Sphingorhabdus sp. YGSMI21 TaxID=2077182 RepID=UPI000C1F622A|nr:hypothetical protein [Sphingorhabdus sp. YGSMI21]ATW03504.1 hypothetical protein CHN51_08125 [Sphingorhabdus sp. YGSMI21]